MTDTMITRNKVYSKMCVGPESGRTPTMPPIPSSIRSPAPLTGVPARLRLDTAGVGGTAATGPPFVGVAGSPVFGVCGDPSMGAKCYQVVPRIVPEYSCWDQISTRMADRTKAGPRKKR